MVESVRLRRLRWRLRGATAWPAFAVLTVADAIVLARLPFAGSGIDLFGALIAAGFINVLTLALLAPLGGFLLRRRRPDLPFLIARDHAGTACLLAVFAGLLAGGLLHRSELASQRADRLAVAGAVHDYVVRREPAYRAGLPMLDTIRTEDARYRACVPGGEELPLCFYVNTDQSPPGIVRDTERYTNAELQR
jgi:hypothetical protein